MWSRTSCRAVGPLHAYSSTSSPLKNIQGGFSDWTYACQSSFVKWLRSNAVSCGLGSFSVLSVLHWPHSAWKWSSVCSVAWCSGMMWSNTVSDPSESPQSLHCRFCLTRISSFSLSVRSLRCLRRRRASKATAVNGPRLWPANGTEMHFAHSAVTSASIAWLRTRIVPVLPSIPGVLT